MEESLDTQEKKWNRSTRVGFRFVFLFFLLLITLNNNGAYPFWDSHLMKYPTQVLHKLIPWIGEHVLHLPYKITKFPYGSGDTTYNYVLLLSILVVAISGTIVWSLLDRKTRHHEILFYWLTVATRFYVALMMINYGLGKVIKLQFPDPNLYRLTGSYGDSSPMGLAWTFFGLSYGFNVFIGAVEIAAVLLLFRRTAAFGALIALATAANIMAVNYAFDVPVKIISTTLVLMILFLLLRDAGSLINFFFTEKVVSLRVVPDPPLARSWMRPVKLGIKFLIVGTAIVYSVMSTWDNSKIWGDSAPKARFSGLYEVDTFVASNDTLPPLKTDAARWDRLIIRAEGFAIVRFMDDSVGRFYTKIDTTSRRIDFSARTDTTIRYSFRYEAPDSARLCLKGVFKSDSITVSMRRNAEKFLLSSRGFHWINEEPFNR